MSRNRASLLRQAGWRLGAAFVAALLIVGGASAGFYFAALKRSATIHGDSLAEFYRDRLKHIEGRWEVDGIELKSRFAPPKALENRSAGRNGSERYVASVGETRIAALHVDDPQDRVLFKRGATLAGAPENTPAPAPPFWHYDNPSGVLHRGYSQVVSLGAEGGMGHLHWYVAIDDAFLSTLTAAGSELYALVQGKVVASSTGRPPAEGVDSLAADRDIVAGDRVTVQRRVQWGEDPGHPTLVFRHQVANPISGGELVASALGILATMVIAMGLALGRWLLHAGGRLRLLGEASSRFGRSRQLTPEVAQRIARAGAERDDEISEVATALEALMRGVVERERERDEREAALRRAQERLAEAEEIAGLCHFEIDWSARRVRLNEQFFRVHRLALEDVGGYEMGVAAFRHRFVHPDDLSRLERMIRQCLEASDPEGTFEAEYRFFCGDGSIRWIKARCRAAPEPEGAPRRLVGTAEDIQERKEAEEARRAADLARGLVAVQEEERRGLAQSLHDTTSPNLAAIKLNLGLMKAELCDKCPAARKARLEEMMGLLNETSTGLREVCFELRPASLDYFGLVPAIESYAQQFLKRAGIAVQVDGGTLTERLPPDLENTAFRIVQEALTNCAKHSGARSVTITLEGGTPQLRLTIADDGVGFDPDRLKKPGLGLITMRERAELTGGRLTVDSRPGTGTRIEVTLGAPAGA